MNQPAAWLRDIGRRLANADVDGALALSEPVLRSQNPAAIYALARTFADAGYLPLAITALQRCVELEPEVVEYPLTLANCLAQNRQHRLAAGYYEQADKLAPGNPNILHALANSQIVAGSTDLAGKTLQKALSIDPTMAPAHYLLSTVRRYESRDDDHIRSLESLLEKSNHSGRDYSRMAFALGRALDQVGDYDAAFEWMTKANAARKTGSDFDIENEKRLVDSVINAYSNELFDQVGGHGFDADWPVLIVGMPRSGSTLVEQILASHPNVYGAGETMDLSHTLHLESMRLLSPGCTLPDAASQIPALSWRLMGEQYAERLRQYDQNVARIVDKQLFNYFDLGPARLMLPNLKIIHCVRDPMDTCLSCFFTAFKQDRGFTYDLMDLGQSFQLYRRLMQHWQKTLPDIYEVRYENLVQNQHSETSKLLDYLGLPWDDACLSFEDNAREVATSSQAQVRQKMYTGSINRWHNYRKQLQTLKEIIDNSE